MSSYKAPLEDIRFALFDVLDSEQTFARLGFADANRELVDAVIEAIVSKAKTGQIGDGKIFVYPLDHVVRIRTGETDTEAL